jgi:DNA repair protein SbcC/Rad50
MRILGVRFKNLNSLTGEWHVDFTHPDYGFDGIFAITGPTGAGKTTILDAICLGLYGRTPRLDKVTKSGNEIMSRQTGECFAEVTFETQKGRYRCNWSQHRARKQPEGELQYARHEIADADSGAVLESKITLVGQFIEKVTGMDFERFTRSMLLAQGGFAAFLQAPPDERAPILEQITGTEIYSHISMKAHERLGEEREKLDILQATLKGISILNEEEEKELHEGMKEKQSRESESIRQIEGLRKDILWVETIDRLEKEVDVLDKQWVDVENRLEAFVPEAARLERARKALAIEADYRGLTTLRAQQFNETKELDAAVLLLPGKEKACANALTAKQAAEAELKRVRDQQQSEGDVIKKVRELDVRMTGQKKQVEEKSKGIEDGERQVNALKKSIDKFEEILKKAQADLSAISDYQTKNGADAALPSNITVIEREFSALRDLESRHVKACEDLVESALKKDSAVLEFKKIEEKHEKIRLKSEQKQSEMKRLSNEITAILKDHDINEWRQEMAALKDREIQLIQAMAINEGIIKASTALEGIERTLATLRAIQTKLTEGIKTTSDQKVLLEKEIGNLEVQVSLLERIRDLNEDRKRLEDGKPCPLCGAVDHPYAIGNVPELNDAETSLKKTKIEFKKVSETLDGFVKDNAGNAAAIEHLTKEIEEKKAAMDADQRQYADALKRLNIQGASEAGAVKMGEALTTAKARIAEISGVVTNAEEKGQKENSARTALEALRARFDESNKVFQESNLKMETASLVHDQITKDRDSLLKDAAKARSTALKDVEPFGIASISSTGLDAMLKGLTQRKDAWLAKMDGITICEKKIGEMKTEIEKAQTLLNKLEKDLTIIHRDLDNLVKEYELLNASRRELFGEKDADKQEKRLAMAAGQADVTLDKVREEYGKIEKEVSGLKEKINVLKENLKNRTTELTQLEQRFLKRVRDAGFENEVDYISSSLNEEARENLTKKQNTLNEEKAGLAARRKDRTKALTDERDKRLTNRTIDKLREELTAFESALKQLQENIGAIKNTLIENEKLKGKQQEGVRAIEARKKEYDRWNNLHQLIGSADGKKFRNFAQGLTFEIMITHANRQLTNMTDRYLLVRDASQPLELNVIDNYQAGEIRSTKNLSGGESFIVSLALALGLSQMSSRNVRVDSLFLDEGFGSLDDEALETALETLAGLQQDGKLIGVISHVAALKERIGTQIQVIPESGGRSILMGPGCAKISGLVKEG